MSRGGLLALIMPSKAAREQLRSPACYNFLTHIGPEPVQSKKTSLAISLSKFVVVTFKIPCIFSTPGGALERARSMLCGDQGKLAAPICA